MAVYVGDVWAETACVSDKAVPPEFWPDDPLSDPVVLPVSVSLASVVPFAVSFAFAASPLSSLVAVELLDGTKIGAPKPEIVDMRSS